MPAHGHGNIAYYLFISKKKYTQNFITESLLKGNSNSAIILNMIIIMAKL